MKMMRASAILSTLVLIGTPVLAQSPRVVDGDTIKLDGTTYRLWGIDAPETHQLCNGMSLGVAATANLQNLVDGKTVVWEARTKDRYGQSVALSRADGLISAPRWLKTVGRSLSSDIVEIASR